MWSCKTSLFLLLLIFPVIRGNIIGSISEEDFNLTMTSYDDIKTIEESTLTMIEDLRKSFDAFEEYSRNYTDYMQLQTTLLREDIDRFITDIEYYFAKLPMEEAIETKKESRAKCFCNGEWKEPCPTHCINSCHLDGYSVDDCKPLLMISTKRNCKCDKRSTVSCSEGMDACYDVETTTEIYKPPCIEHAINRTIFIASFKLFAHLLIEPQKVLYRDVYFKLNKMKENLSANEMLANQLCDGRRATSCFPEANTLLRGRLESDRTYLQTMTLDLINAQKVINDVKNNLHVFKEQNLKQINRAIKNYGCCLNGMMFNMANKECEESQRITEEFTQFTSPMTTPKARVHHHYAPWLVTTRPSGYLFNGQIR